LTCGIKKLSLGAEDSYTSGAMPAPTKTNGNGNGAAVMRATPPPANGEPATRSNNTNGNGDGASAVMKASAPINGGHNLAVMRVLGVDPAMAGATGYGVVEFCGARIRALSFGALRLPDRALMPERLRGIHSLIAGLLAEFHPDAIAVESVFTALNIRTALKLAEIRGVVLLAAAQAGVPAHSYSPREVKVSVTGYGAASKVQMQQMVRALLNLRECPEPPDAADAIAVAMCHAQSEKARELLSASIASAVARSADENIRANQTIIGARTRAKANAGNPAKTAPGTRVRPAVTHGR
jgi:crossover junction endodeoxyribonuclease RuvC